MGGGSKKQTIGYKIYVGMQMALCGGPVDRITQVLVDKREAWRGAATGGPVTISSPNLFGGTKKEGGVEGIVDFDLGWDDQVENTYLQSQLGDNIPAFRGVTCCVLNQTYVGMSPYLKPWAFRAQRIHITDSGDTDSNYSTQWYDEKAEISGSLGSFESFFDNQPGWEKQGTGIYNYPHTEFFYYKISDSVSGYSSSPGTTYAQGGYGSKSDPLTGTMNTFVGSICSRAITVTKYLVIPHGQHLVTINTINDDGCAVFVNGVRILPPDLEVINYYGRRYTFISSPGQNPVITIQVINCKNDDFGDAGGNSGIFAGLEITVTYQDSDISRFGIEHSDMNPAHIIRECLTNYVWGMGYSDTDIDDSSFVYAADLLYAESMGISVLWSSSIPLDEFIADILRHIDGVLYVSRSTGKFVLKLLRDDYGSDILVIDDVSIVEISVKRPTIGELTNAVSVVYWDPATDEDASVTIHNQALMQMQGSEIITKIQYPGFTNEIIASQVANRDLKALSTPLMSCEITTTRISSDLNVGDAFILNHPDLEIYDVVMRVSTIDLGDGITNKIEITAIEDVFSIPDFAAANRNIESWSDPLSNISQSALPRLVTEIPYYFLVRNKGQLTADTVLIDEPDAGFLAVIAGRQGAEHNANMLVDSGDGYTDSGVLDFSGYATLYLDVALTDTQIYYTLGVDLEDVETGSIVQLDNELMRVDNFGADSNGHYVSVGRGVLDTIPTLHYAGSDTPYLIFWENNVSSNDKQYTAFEVTDVKIQTVGGGAAILDSDAAPTDSVAFNSRAIRPYPPGNFKINGVLFNDIIGTSDAVTISWAHRDRLQQTGSVLMDFTDTNIGPEDGTTYTIRIYGERDTLGRTETGISSTTYYYNTDDEKNDFLLPDGNIDEYFDDVISSIHFDNVDDSTTFIDVVAGTWTTYGSAHIESDWSAFGGSSGKFNGSTDYIESSSLPNLNKTDFTIQFWVRFMSGTRPQKQQAVFSRWEPSVGSNQSFIVFFDAPSVSSAPTELQMDFRSGPSNYYNNTLSYTFAFDADYYIEINRTSNNLRFFVNGSLELTAAVTTAHNNSTLPYHIGKASLSGNWYLNGYIDDFRVTNNVARHLSSYTPPTNPHPDASADSNTSFRLNSHLRIELESHRAGYNSDGYNSMQMINHVVSREIDSNYDSDFGS